MDALIAVLNEFGATALWGIVIYKALDFVAGITLTLMVGFGIRWMLYFIRDN